MSQMVLDIYIHVEYYHSIMGELNTAHVKPFATLSSLLAYVNSFVTRDNFTPSVEVTIILYYL